MENPAEVQELRNKLRMMKFPQDEIINTVRRQQRAISKQRQANATLQKEIELYEQENAKTEKIFAQYQSNETLKGLEEEKKSLLRKVDSKEGGLVNQQKKIKESEMELKKKREELANMRKSERNDMKDNRLNQAHLRYSESLRTLEQFRHQIDELRKEKRIFKGVWRRAKKECKDTEKKISELITESNKAYEKRDTFKRRIVEIRDAEKKEMEEHESTMTRIKEEIKAHEIKTKGHSALPGQPISQMNSQIGSSSDMQEEAVTLTEKYETTKTQILSLLHFDTVDQLIEEAERVDSENFSLYNYVMEEGRNKLALQEELEALKKRYQNIKDESEKTEEEQKKSLAALRQRIEDSENLMNSRKISFHSERLEFQQIYQKMESMFNALGCSWEGCPDGKSTIVPSNAKWVMSRIEEKISEVMNGVYERASLQDATTPQETESRTFEGTRSFARIPVSPSHLRLTAEKDPRLVKLLESSRPLTIDEINELL